MNSRLPWLAILLILLGCQRPTPARSPIVSKPSPKAAPMSAAPDAAVTGRQPALKLDLPGEPAIIAKVAPYSVDVDLKAITNLDEFAEAYRFSDSQKKLLSQNLFVCSPTDFQQMCFLYDNNDYLNLPSFVSTDAVLQLYHIFYMSTLRNVEISYLLPALRRLTDGMYAESIKILKASGSGPIHGAALKNAAYFAVAMNLLGRKTEMPAEVASLVDIERRLVDAHAGSAVGGIFPYKLDYSLFVPRGHYTRTLEQRQYFMTMVWFGTSPFALTYDGPMGPARADEQIRQALLLVASLYRTKLDSEWMRIYEPTAFYVGSADDHTPADWRQASERVFGRLPALSDYADTAKLAQFVNEIKKLKPARIAPKLVFEKDIPDTNRQLRFMGQRYLVDSDIIQKLTGENRPMPSGLDAMAGMGSIRAAAILDSHPDVYNPNKWDAYPAERDRAAEKVASLALDVWTSNLYWGWLHTLRALLAPVPEGYPSFMRNEAWTDKSLHTALASWSELRHDAILYAKPTVAEMGDEEDRPMPKGYVEPNVRFWNRLFALTEQSRAGLERRGFISNRLKDDFENFETLLKLLRTASEKELRNEELSQEEYQQLREIGGTLERMTLSLMPNRPNEWSLVTPVDRDMAVIADVHTAPPLRLEVGVGHAYDMLVIVQIRGKLYLTRGAAFSYYEFTQPMSDTLTDAKWQKLLNSGRPPATPVWTSSFLVGTKPQSVKPGELALPRSKGI